MTSVQDGIHALWKVHMRSTPPLRNFPNVALGTFPTSDTTSLTYKEQQRHSMAPSPSAETDLDCSPFPGNPECTCRRRKVAVLADTCRC